MRPIALIDIYFLVVITVVRITSWFPYRWVRMSVGTILGELSYRLSRSKRARMTRAINAAFDNRLTDHEQTHILKTSFRNLWVEVLGSKPNRIDAEATRNAEIVGWEHLEHALAAGKGVILWENGSFGRRFWAKQILSQHGVLVHQIHGQRHLGALVCQDNTWIRQHLIRPFFDDPERLHVAEFVRLPATGSLAYGRTLLQRLQKNEIVCVAGDGLAGTGFVIVPFLGAKYRFSTGMVSLARMSGAAILPMVCIEREDGKACLVLEDPIQVNKDDDRERQTEEIFTWYVNLMERYIHRDPGSFRSWQQIDWVQENIIPNPPG